MRGRSASTGRLGQGDPADSSDPPSWLRLDPEPGVGLGDHLARASPVGRGGPHQRSGRDPARAGHPFGTESRRCTSAGPDHAHSGPGTSPFRRWSIEPPTAPVGISHGDVQPAERLIDRCVVLHLPGGRRTSADQRKPGTSEHILGRRAGGQRVDEHELAGSSLFSVIAADVRVCQAKIATGSGVGDASIDHAGRFVVKPRWAPPGIALSLRRRSTAGLAVTRTRWGCRPDATIRCGS